MWVVVVRRLQSSSPDCVEVSVLIGSGDGVIEIVGSGDKRGGFSERVGD